MRARPEFEAGFAHRHVSVSQSVPRFADRADVRVAERDAQARPTSKPHRRLVDRVVAGHPAFVAGLVQHGAIAVDVAGNEDRQVGDLHGLPIERRHAAIIQIDPQSVECEVFQVRRPSDTDQELVDEGAFAVPRDPQQASVFLDLRRRPQVHGKITANEFAGQAIDLRILEAANAGKRIETDDIDAHPAQGLPQLEADRAQPENGDLLGELRLLKDRGGR